LTINSQVHLAYFFLKWWPWWLIFFYQFSPMLMELPAMILLSVGDQEAATFIKKLISNSSRAKRMFRPF
jgi:hypothetical protein